MATTDTHEPPDHGQAVRDAMTPGERGLTLVVLILNVCLGVALILAGDFASLRPNDADPIEDSVQPFEDEHADERLTLMNTHR